MKHDVGYAGVNKKKKNASATFGSYVLYALYPTMKRFLMLPDFQNMYPINEIVLEYINAC